MKSGAGLLVAVVGVLAAQPVRSCGLDESTVFAVYSDTFGGVGNGSSAWEQSFWSWWASADDDIRYALLTKEDVAQLCDLSTFPNLRLYVQPGGNAYEQETALTSKGAANINTFLNSRADAQYMGTCAGWYYSTSAFYWQGSFYTFPVEPSLLARFPATVEGSITDIANYDQSPPYAATSLSNNLTALYYGGPTRGWKDTPKTLPLGTHVLATFSEVGDGDLPAAVTFQDMLLWSVHLEAMEVDPAGEVAPNVLTAEQVLANYQFRANTINSFLGTAFAVPTSLM
uniref:Biotin-protein ligase N-terminal domain-containing protein n=1 Tax=Rhizochromulina marina TaxID=1034831 RepID=A0A7S2R509_9STRA|mmetsp:Transcript_10977/g.31500  ORF Transcript_10977/g.31500 Transcript_10977/m.31500 type:complete len:285 (+) Transcript_10977:1-855(+)